MNNISEPIFLFLFGIPIPIISLMLQIWSTFKSTNKDKEANKTILIGIIVLLIYIAFFLYILGLLDKPKEILQNLFTYKITLGPSILLLLIIFILNKLIPLGIKLFSKGRLIKTETPNTLKVTSSSKSVVFRDKLNGNLNKWITICGNPQISNIRGNPTPPSLLLEENPQDRRNSFLIAKNTVVNRGDIDCFAYLERDAVFNITFRVNGSASDFYMARVDSRSGGSNGILVSRNNNWSYINQPNKYVLPDVWHHVELKFSDSKIIFKIDNDTIIENTRNVFPKTQNSFGMFNEVKRVFVDNFKVYQ